MNIKIYNRASGCPIYNTIQFISGKWKSVILYHLFQNHVLRFSEIEKRMPYTSKRMVAKQLKELRQDHLISKTNHGYQLTTFGKSFRNVIKAMEEWGNSHTHQIKDLLRTKKM